LDLSARRLVASPLSEGEDQEDDGAVSYDVAKYSAANRLKASGGGGASGAGAGAGASGAAVAAASGDGGDGAEGGDGAIVDAAAADGGDGAVVAAAPKAAASELKVRRWK